MLLFAFVHVVRSEAEFEDSEYGRSTSLFPSPIRMEECPSSFQNARMRNNFYKNDFSVSHFLVNNAVKRKNDTKNGNQEQFS